MTAELTISEFKAALKKIGLQTVTSQLNSHQTRSYRGIMGISGGSIGPMTATSAHHEHNIQVECKISRLLADMGIPYHYSDRVITIILNTGKKKVEYKFIWNKFRTYAHNEYDPSYMTYWYTLNKI